MVLHGANTGPGHHPATKPIPISMEMKLGTMGSGQHQVGMRATKTCRSGTVGLEILMIQKEAPRMKRDRGRQCKEPAVTASQRQRQRSGGSSLQTVLSNALTQPGTQRPVRPVQLRLLQSRKRHLQIRHRQPHPPPQWSRSCTRFPQLQRRMTPSSHPWRPEHGLQQWTTWQPRRFPLHWQRGFQPPRHPRFRHRRPCLQLR